MTRRTINIISIEHIIERNINLEEIKKVKIKKKLIPINCSMHLSAYLSIYTYIYTHTNIHTTNVSFIILLSPILSSLLVSHDNKCRTK
jgi:hypothetical protein